MKTLFLISTLLFLSSCITREEVDAVIWLNNFNDDKNSMAGVCERNPEIKQYGFYRKLNNGKLEFVSICNTTARNYLAVQKDDFNRLIDKALPKPPEQN
jgi:hypothetical protein